MKRSYRLLFIVTSLLFLGGVSVYSYEKKIESSPAPQNLNFEGSIKNKQAQNSLDSENKLLCKDCNLVIISLTNTRKNNLSLYGYERNTSPYIDNFFKNSLLFENAFAPASWTLPVTTSFFTSLFPDSHGVMDRYDGSMLSDNVLTLAEILKQNGYKTAAFTGGGDFNKQFNHDQGFDIFDDQGTVDSLTAYAGTDVTVPSAIDWLNKIEPKDKFFLLVQGYDTHCPFTPIAPYDTIFTGNNKSTQDYSKCLWTFGQTKPIFKNGVRLWPVKTMAENNGITHDAYLTDEDIEYMTALYDGEIAEADNNLDDLFKIFEKKGLTKNTIFVFMSEHGDLLGEHGRFMRGGPLRGTFYDPVLNFPLAIRHPNIDTPVKINALVQTVDLMPTFLDMLGLKDEQSKTREGKSLISDLAGGLETNQYVYAGSTYNALNNVFFKGSSRVEVIRSRDWKLTKEVIATDKEALASNSDKNQVSYELYNVSKDPAENNNLINKDKDIAASLKAKLEEWKNALAKQ